jgi:hypothetical protein
MGAEEELTDGGGRGPVLHDWFGEGEAKWREGEGRGWAAIYRAKLCTCQPAAAGGRCYSDDLGWRVLTFSACFRILVAAQNIFLDLHTTIFVQNLR